MAVLGKEVGRREELAPARLPRQYVLRNLCPRRPRLRREARSRVMERTLTLSPFSNSLRMTASVDWETLKVEFCWGKAGVMIGIR